MTKYTVKLIQNPENGQDPVTKTYDVPEAIYDLARDQLAGLPERVPYTYKHTRTDYILPGFPFVMGVIALWGGIKILGWSSPSHYFGYAFIFLGLYGLAISIKIARDIHMWIIRDSPATVV